MNHAHWTNKEETFYSYATGNIYYTIQKNYNEVKAVPLLLALFPIF